MEVYRVNGGFAHCGRSLLSTIALFLSLECNALCTLVLWISSYDTMQYGVFTCALKLTGGPV